MEYTQWGTEYKNPWSEKVLILVVMEYTQWEDGTYTEGETKGLNPCCNGIYSMSSEKTFAAASLLCLNPCCNGIYSMRSGNS